MKIINLNIKKFILYIILIYKDKNNKKKILNKPTKEINIEIEEKLR